MPSPENLTVLALTGGVGGAKLALGLADVEARADGAAEGVAPVDELGDAQRTERFVLGELLARSIESSVVSAHTRTVWSQAPVSSRPSGKNSQTQIES